MKARGVVVRYRVKWKTMGDKCIAEFFKTVQQKNLTIVISKLRDRRGKVFTKRRDLDRIQSRIPN